MGCGSSAAVKAAPNLAQYFSCQQKMMDAVGDANPMELMMDPAKMQEVTKTEAFKEECRSLAGQSFDHHDKDRSEHLDVAEAKIFFQNYVTLFLDFHEKNDVKMLKRQMAASMKMMAGLMDMMGDEGKKQLKEQEKAAIAQLENNLKDKRANYNRDKDSCDANGFAVLDHNGDGKVYKKDMVDALTPDTEMYDNVHCALGLLDAMEVAMTKQAKQMQGQMTDMPGGCAQQ